MNGKGSKPRPLSVSQSEFDRQWDLIFGGKNMKHEHKRGVVITEELSRFMSADGRREGVVVKSEKGFMVELYENKKYLRTVDVTAHSEQYADDTAENWALGVFN